MCVSSVDFQQCVQAMNGHSVIFITLLNRQTPLQATFSFNFACSFIFQWKYIVFIPLCLTWFYFKNLRFLIATSKTIATIIRHKSDHTSHELPLTLYLLVCCTACTSLFGGFVTIQIEYRFSTQKCLKCCVNTTPKKQNLKHKQIKMMLRRE